MGGKRAARRVAPEAATQQITLLEPDVAVLAHLLRENLRLAADFATRYEVGRTPIAPDLRAINAPADAAAYLRTEMEDLAQEQLRALLLDTKNQVLGVVLIYQGSLNAISVRLAECFREAVRANAAGLILVHNHPSGRAQPSPEDVRLTRDAAQAGDLLGIQLLDHVVIGRGEHVSLRERGLYTPAARLPLSMPPKGEDQPC